jgi:hypothetical protein
MIYSRKSKCHPPSLPPQGGRVREGVMPNDLLGHFDFGFYLNFEI